ncbi:hypothetical protein CRUP_032708 [Coryphaenoides rupestris]|nr:hypothetical protein CRUP_032708 [Coryphaenoides rupestris]
MPDRVALSIPITPATVTGYLTPRVVCSSVVMPTVVKMVPTSRLTVFWSRPTHMASASRKGTAMVPLKHPRKVGQMGSRRSQRTLRTTPIPTGKSHVSVRPSAVQRQEEEELGVFLPNRMQNMPPRMGSGRDANRAVNFPTEPSSTMMMAPN